jgi:3-(3-hydroxy-phenyl)propionate hydroxylase
MQTKFPTDKSRVLIAGAGPVGLICALRLSQAGIPVTVFEQHDRLLDDPRAATTHPATLEMLDEVGIEEEVEAQGLVCAEFKFWDRPTGDLVACFDHALLADETKFPYVVQCEQFKIARITLAKLQSFPNCEVLFSHRVTDASQDAEGVSVTVDNPNGTTQKIPGAFLIGADGGQSAVRKAVNIDLQGFTYNERFVVLTTPFDFGADDRYAYRNYFADPDEWCNLFKVAADGPPGLWRTVFPTVAGETDEEVLSDDAVQARLKKFFPRSNDYEVIHRNLYVTHQRVAKTFREGRVLLAGDAAHLNNPIGGMGLNGGIHDAMNLTEKLARVWHGDAEISDLDLYDHQRRTITNEFVQAQTIQNKQRLEEKDPERRRRALDNLRKTAADRHRAKDFLLGTSMLASVRRAATLEHG